jgi:hypothetical protein
MMPARGTDCPNALHDWPLPAGFVAASDIADARLRARWRNLKCPQCQRYGWKPGERGPDTRPIEVKP